MNNRNQVSRAGTTGGYDNNKIAIAIILGLGALGIIWYGVDNYVLHPTPAVHAKVAPMTEPVGQGPGVPGRP